MAKPSLTHENVEEYRQELLAKHGAAMRAFLRPSEALQAVAVANIGASVKDPPMRYMPKSDRISDWSERAGRVGDAINYGPGNALWRITGFIIRDKPSISGGWESQAGRFVIAVSAAAKRGWTISRHLCLAKTDHRVLLLTEPSAFGSRPVKMLGEYASAEIAIRPGWHVKPGDNQVDVGFADGSWLSLTAELPAGPALIAQLLGTPAQLG